jgi:hypothetical protein
MSFKFVQSSDNKYIQARCMAQNFTTDVTQWQGVDDEPTAGSSNLVKSGGVCDKISTVATNTNSINLEEGGYAFTSLNVGDVVPKTINSKRVRSCVIKGDFYLEVNTGYTIRALITMGAGMTYISSSRDIGQSVTVEDSDNEYHAVIINKSDDTQDINSYEDIIKTFKNCYQLGVERYETQNNSRADNTDIEIKKKTLFKVNSDIKNIYLEQGGINANAGYTTNNSTRVRTEYLPAQIDISVNDGYNIQGVYYYDKDFVFVKSNTSIFYDSVKIHSYNKGYVRIVFCKIDNTQDILPSENIIATVNTPTANDELLPLSNESLEALQDYEQQYEQVSGDITSVTGKMVDIYTGELNDSSYSTKVYSITKNDVRASFLESGLSSSGWCILANGTVVASCHTTISNVLADVDLGYYVRRYNADTLMIGVNNSVTFDGVTVTRTKNTIKESIDKLSDDIEDLQEEVGSIPIVFDVPDEFETKTQNYDESAGRRTVDASTGEYASAATDSYAGEYVIQPEDISISYNTTKYTTNKGWVLLADDNTVIHGEKTDDVADIIITLSDYPEAKKFRWCGRENSKSITIIAGVVKNIKDVVEDGYTKYKPFFDGTLNFHFTFAKPQLNNVSATGVEKVTTDIVNGAGLLRLAKNYSRDGKPTPLIIYFFGSAGYGRYSTSDFDSNYLPYIDYLTKCGYNVMSAFGFYQDFDTDYQTKGSRNFGCPVCMSAFVNAYKYVTNNYNVDKNGVYVYGRSFAGSNVVLFGFNSNIKVRAAGMFNCYIGDVSNEYLNRPELVKDFIFDGDVNFEWTSSYVLANFDKVAPWSNLTRGIVNGFASRSDIVYAIMNPNTFMGGHNAEDYVRYQPYPMKMWCPDDDGICAGMKWYRQTVLNSGGRCEYRTMPSNYTDGERVPESVPHHICDTAGPVYATLTTKLGYECENVPVAYKELIDWFDNN